MTFRLSQRSLNILSKVDVRLQLVTKRAIQLSCVDFAVVQGLRTMDEQMRLYGKGRTAAQCAAKGVPTAYARPNEDKVTWTLNSRHRTGRAVDVCPYIDGKPEWDNNGKLGLWPKIAAAFRQAAAEQHVPLVWGGDWGEGQTDRPHFELG